MKIEDLIRLIETMQSSNFDEFILELQDLKMTLRRGGKLEYVPLAHAPAQAVPAAAPDLTPALPDEPVREAGLVEVLAPMVGTYYQSPSPDSAPFVESGARVKPGDTLCILEAMKLMNEIQAETEGEIVEIFARNGELVEYGQVLMTIRPDRL